MRFLIGALAPLSLLLSSPSWGQDYLYRPQPVAQGEQPAVADGVLVREVLVKKGDTLSHISKRFSGRGGYYPQILLFNSIKNPHLIYPGDLLRVPVSGQRQMQAPAAKKVAVSVKPVAASLSKPAGAAAGKQQENPEQAAYTRALAAFKRDDCTEAVLLFDRFMVDFPQSALVPDAILNRAECYLRQSAN